MFNIFKKKEKPVIAYPKTHFEKIKLEICFKDGDRYCKYNKSSKIVNENLSQFNKDRADIYAKYNAIIKKIHEDLDSKISDYISVDDSYLLIKKSDFFNARVVGEDEDEDLRKKD